MTTSHPITQTSNITLLDLQDLEVAVADLGLCLDCEEIQDPNKSSNPPMSTSKKFSLEVL